MLAGTGTPIVAVVSGSVQFKQTNLGGNSVWLSGSDGNRYFFAHLSSFAGSSRSVSQGEVIGYVGDTGNARGTPHLHFEVHPGGGAADQSLPLRPFRRLLGRRRLFGRCDDVGVLKSTKFPGSPARWRAASWPQAASMSVPRLRRIVAPTPRASRWSRNWRTREAGEPVVGQPGVGLSGIRLTCAAGRSRRARPASSTASCGPVVDAVDHRPLEADPPPGDVDVVLAGADDHVERVPAVERHELVAQCVVGGMDADGEGHRQASSGEGTDAGDDADCRKRDVPRRESEVVVDPLRSRPHGRLVRQRLAHPHEDDVAQPASSGAGAARRRR